MNTRRLSPRQAILDGLNKICQDKAYSNLMLDSLLSQGNWEKQDTGFITALLYGVLERTITLDAVIARYSKKKPEKLDLPVLNILRMGIYQLLYMQSVPESAAVNESVKLVAYARKSSASGFVNAILRGFVRDGCAIPYPEQSNWALYTAVKESCPVWLLELWAAQYGRETAQELAKAQLAPPPLTLRVNTLKVTTQELLDALHERGLDAQENAQIDHAVTLKSTVGIATLPEYKKGWFHVQDVSSQLCAAALEVSAGQRVLDVCAAPGGKSMTLAQQMNNQGSILAMDLYEHKQKLIEATSARLGVRIVTAGLQDASEYSPALGEFDRVLCDVPCSGFGVIRRKPEIKLKSPLELENLPDTQLAILKTSAAYVKQGGILVYSTCTLNQKENEKVCETFLNENNQFKRLKFPHELCRIEIEDPYEVTLFPPKTGTDGFFIARFIKETD